MNNKRPSKHTPNPNEWAVEVEEIGQILEEYYTDIFHIETDKSYFGERNRWHKDRTEEATQSIISILDRAIIDAQKWAKNEALEMLPKGGDGAWACQDCGAKIELRTQKGQK